MPAFADQRPVLHVVSYLAHDQFGPRGARTRHVIEAVSPEWQVDLISGPPSRSTSGRSLTRRAWDYGLYVAHARLAIDRYETWSLRRLAPWRPTGRFGLLIGYPFSPLAYGARALRRAEIPYVVDVGDPWTLTARSLGTRPHSSWRGGKAERAVWEGAAGGIVTTRQQADALAELFPHVPMFVRPNGYESVAGRTLPARIAPPPDELHLGHFGRLYWSRIDIGDALDRLVQSRRWRRIVIHQFGEGARNGLGSLPAEVEMIAQPARPWSEIQAAAARLHAALVIGHRSPSQLPSKVIEYATLPAPRVAVVRDPETDAITDYVRDKPGWLVVRHDAPDLAEQFAAHIGRDWTESELAPPSDEAWPRVAEQIAAFIGERFNAT
jgi:hypothetical protein